MNSLGRILRLTTFGESHGPAMGGILDGLPSGISIDLSYIQAMIDRRRTGKDILSSQRKETDIPEILSGLSPESITLGTPIGFIFRNKDARSEDYDEIARRFRPNHADYTYQIKYGIRDYRGGGRASARETVNWVMGGALVMQWLKTFGIRITARLTKVGDAGYEDPFERCIKDPVNSCLPNDEEVESAMLSAITTAKKMNDSIGGRVSCLITGVPAGLGEPVFGKVQARLAEAMMSLNAVKAFEYGAGTEASRVLGSKTLDLFNPMFSPLPTSTNHQGGILGGISSGMPIYFNVHFKPAPSLSRSIPMPDIEGEIERVITKGRHDPCVAMRAPVIVEALAALTIGDLILLSRHDYKE